MKALISIPPRRPSPFVRAAFAQAQSGIRKEPLENFLAKDDKTSAMIINRATQVPASTTGSGWASQLVETAFGDFLADLSPYGGAARVLSQALQATLGSKAQGKYPTRAAGATLPQWVGENGQIPVNIANFSLIDIGPKRKLASIVVWSLELSKRSDAAVIFEAMLREDMAAGLDAALFATSAGSASAHAGLLNGVVAGSGIATGDLAEAIAEDLSALATSVSAGGSGRVLYIMPPDNFARLQIRAPLLADRLDIAASAALPAGRVVAVDPMAILAAVDPAPDIEVGTQATLHMSDLPLEIVDDSAVVADPVRSAWQTASTAFRCIYEMAWAKRRASAVAYLDGAIW